MGTYVNFFSYERDSWHAMVASPQDRSEVVRRVLEAAGGELEAFYWMLGEYDGMVIFRVPDAIAAAAVSAAISAGGRVASMRTTRLLNSEETRLALEQAGVVRAAYDPPGGPPRWRTDFDEGTGIA